MLYAELLQNVNCNGFRHRNELPALVPQSAARWRGCDANLNSKDDNRLWYANNRGTDPQPRRVE